MPSSQKVPEAVRAQRKIGIILDTGRNSIPKSRNARWREKGWRNYREKNVQRNYRIEKDARILSTAPLKGV
jgi:hypothetical protein